MIMKETDFMVFKGIVDTVNYVVKKTFAVYYSEGLDKIRNAKFNKYDLFDLVLNDNIGNEIKDIENNFLSKDIKKNLITECNKIWNVSSKFFFNYMNEYIIYYHDNKETINDNLYLINKGLLDTVYKGLDERPNVNVNKVKEYINSNYGDDKNIIDKKAFECFVQLCVDEYNNKYIWKD